MNSQSDEPMDSKQDNTLSFTVDKVDAVPYANVPMDVRSGWPLTMTTATAESEGSCVAHVTSISATLETTPKPTSEGITTCPPHHWVITHPRSKFNRGNDGELVETTDQTCKKCGEFRLNEVVVPPERATAPGLELGGS